MSLKNSKYFDLIKQNINSFKLDLRNYNVLLPASPKEPSLLAVIAATAGANNIYVKTNKLPVKNNIIKAASELGIENIRCVENVTLEILSGINIIVKGGEIDTIDSAFLSKLNKKAVITLLPENLDFSCTEGIETEACGKGTASVIGINPEDKTLNLYKYYSHIILKRCYESGLDVYNSRILLAGQGVLLEETLKLLKSAGAVVFTCDTQKPVEHTNIVKNMPGLDAIIIADYPPSAKQVIGSNGVIPISDIVDLSPYAKIIHFSGKLDEISVNLGKIKCFPEKITQNSTNLNISELGEKALVELSTACLKAADSFIKSNIYSLQTNDSIVIYKVLNKKQTVLLGIDR